MKCIALLVCLAACKGGLKMEKRELPGLSFELPEGREDTTDQPYGAGRIVRTVSSIEGASLALRWNFALPLGEESMLDVARNSASDVEHPAKSPALPGDPPHTYAVDEEHQHLMTFYRCGNRNVWLFTDNVGESVHRRIGKSYECKPDKAQEDAATRIPIHIELPSFVALKRLSGVLILDEGNTRVRLMVHPLTEVIEDPADYLEAFGLTDIKVKHEGGTVTFRAHREAEERWGLMREVNCADVAVRVIAEGTAEKIALLWKNVDAARCAVPGEQPSDWPDAQQ